MPENSKVHNLYEKLLKKGYSKASAAKISQSQTHQSLQTGKAPKGKE